jgi:hypothetical protein
LLTRFRIILQYASDASVIVDLRTSNYSLVLVTEADGTGAATQREICGRESMLRMEWNSTRAATVVFTSSKASVLEYQQYRR